MNSKKVWKLKKLLCPKSRDPPAAMLDKGGYLLTENSAIETRAIEVYSERLKPNEMEEHFKNHEHTMNDLCKGRLKVNSKNKSKE